MDTDMNLYRFHAALLMAAMITGSAPAAAMTFHLLCWTNDTPALPTAVGRRPAANASVTNDWLVFTADDDLVGGSFNPYGALSHSFEDIAPQGGALADAMPSLSGSFEMAVTELTPALYTMQWQRIDFNAQIEPSHRGHIQLVEEQDDDIVTNPVYGVDGVPNAGYWRPATWRCAFSIDIFAVHEHETAATHAVTLDEHQHEVAHAHDNQYFEGWLVPMIEATPAALASNMPADVAGFYAGAFNTYVQEQVLPRVPAGAAHVLVAQAPKKRVAFSHEGMTTNSLFGLTLIAYSYDEIPEPVAAVGLAGLAGLALARRGRHAR